MRTTIWRDHVVDLVIWNRRPLAVYFDFVMVADHTALSRATVHEIAAGAFAIVSVQLRVEALMPFIVAYPVISFLRRCAYTKKHGERAAEQRGTRGGRSFDHLVGGHEQFVGHRKAELLRSPQVNR